MFGSLSLLTQTLYCGADKRFTNLPDMSDACLSQFTTVFLLPISCSSLPQVLDKLCGQLANTLSSSRGLSQQLRALVAIGMRRGCRELRGGLSRN